MTKDLWQHRSPRCRGLAGFIRGHKFNTNTLDRHGHETYFCQRCGYRPPKLPQFFRKELEEI